MHGGALDMTTDGKAILKRPVFGRLLFGQYWEDPRMDEVALDVGPGKALVSIISGGCNTLSLALLGPERILAIDLNDAQICLLELKIAGVRALEHGSYLEMLGVRPSTRRHELYRMSRRFLPRDAQVFWDAHLQSIERGVLRQGRYERYLEAFRRLLLILQGQKRIERLFVPKSPEERRRFYDQEWNTSAWRLFFRVFFSRTVLGRCGLDPKFFTYVQGIEDFGEHFRSLAEHVLVDLPAEENYFLAQICLGRYLNERAVPPYLLEENLPALRRAVDRIEIVKAELETALAAEPDESFDGFNLSNIFEWVSPADFERMLRQIHRVARSGARLCYRNLLVRRSHPSALDGLFRPDEQLAARLLHEDRSFVYSRFEVATVLKAPESRSRNHGCP